MIRTRRENKPIRVGVFSVVKHDYLPKAIAAHPRFELVCVADDADRPAWTHERNQKFADDYGIPYLMDIGKAVSEYQLDAVAVSPEAERHCDIAVRAAESGLHIVIDKPLSTRVEECDRLVDALERNNVQCLVWNRNFLPAVIQARRIIESGEIGELVSIHCDFYFSKDAGPAYDPGLGDDRERIEWLDRQLEAHADGSDGGVGEDALGELQVEGIYPLGYIRFLTDGAEARRVFARTRAHFHQAHVDNDVDDLATVSLEMERGIVSTLCIGRIGAASHPDIGEIKIHVTGTSGSLVVSEARPEVSVYYRNQPGLEFKNRRIGDENNFLLAENFARAIDGSEPTVLDARGARNICATVLASIESGRSGKPVEVINRKS